METRERKSRPRVGEKVYQEEENIILSTDRPYGIIKLVDHEGRVATVLYEDNRMEDYEFDDMRWTDRFEGMWIT